MKFENLTNKLFAKYIGNTNPDSMILHRVNSTDGRCQIEEIQEPEYFHELELEEAYKAGFDPCEICMPIENLQKYISRQGS